MPDFPALEDFEGHLVASRSAATSSSVRVIVLPRMWHAPISRASLRTARSDQPWTLANAPGVIGRCVRSSLLTVPRCGGRWTDDQCACDTREAATTNRTRL